MSEINDPTSNDQLSGTNCTAGLDFDDSTGDEWDQLKIVAIVIPIVILLLTIVICAICCFKIGRHFIGAQVATCSNSGYSSQTRGQPNRSFDDGFVVNSVELRKSGNEVYDPKFGHQLGGTNCTAAVTNFERSSECYSDSYSECQPEPDRGTCSVSE